MENCIEMFDEEEVFTFIWSIKKFSMCTVYYEKFISSPTITVSKFGNSEWCLDLYPKGDCFVDSISCYLKCKRLGDDGNTICLKFSLSISSYEKEAEYTFKLMERWGSCNFISVREMLNDRNKYFPNDTLTIKCTMKSKDFVSKKSIEEISDATNRVCRNNLYIDQCCIETTIHVETKSVIWSIEKFRSLLCNERLTLPVLSAMKGFPSFYVTVYKTSEFLINIEILGKEDTRPHISTHFYVTCSVSVIDCNQDVKYCSVDCYYFEYEEDVWRVPPYIKLEDLEEVEYFESTDGTLYLQFDFAFSLDKMCHSEKSYCDPNFMPFKSTLPAKVYTSETIADQHSVVTLKAGDQTFKVHRTALESSSKVFHQTGVVNITDVDPRTVAKMVEFLNCNTMDDLSPTDVAKLYAAGAKYQIKSLVSHCSSILVPLISVSNVCEILDLADLHEDQRLLKFAQDFVKVNCDDILVSDEWEDFMKRSGTLAAKVLRTVLTNDLKDLKIYEELLMMDRFM